MAEHVKAAKIIGIQFSILSPDEIRKSSVAEITSRDTYINNNAESICVVMWLSYRNVVRL